MTIRDKALKITAIAAVVSFGVMGNALAVTVITPSGDISVNPATSPTETQIFLDKNDSTSTGTGHIGSQTGDAGTPPVSFVTNINAAFANGFADISALKDTVISSLTVSVPLGWIFTDLDFSTHKAANVTITAKDGNTTVGTVVATGLSNGDIHWLVEAINGKVFTSFVFTSSDGFDQLKQFSISGLESVCVSDCPPNGPPVVTPLPAALPLFVSGLGALGFVGWRRKRKAAVTA